MLRDRVHGLSQGTGLYLASRSCTCIVVFRLSGHSMLLLVVLCS